jgi:hypothetical protein
MGAIAIDPEGERNDEGSHQADTPVENASALKETTDGDDVPESPDEDGEEIPPPDDRPPVSEEGDENLDERYQQAAAVIRALARQQGRNTHVPIVSTAEPQDLDGHPTPSGDRRGAPKAMGEVGAWSGWLYGDHLEGLVYNTEKSYPNGAVLCTYATVRRSLHSGETAPTFDVHRHEEYRRAPVEQDPWQYVCATQEDFEDQTQIIPGEMTREEYSGALHEVDNEPVLYDDVPTPAKFLSAVERTFSIRPVSADQPSPVGDEVSDTAEPPPVENRDVAAVIGSVPPAEAARYRRLGDCMDATFLLGAFDLQPQDGPGESTILLSTAQPSRDRSARPPTRTLTAWSSDLPSQPFQYCGIRETIIRPGRGRPVKSEISLSFVRDETGLISPLRADYTRFGSDGHVPDIDKLLARFERHLGIQRPSE